MTYWVNVYKSGHLGAWWDSQEQAYSHASRYPKPAYCIKVTLKGKA